MATLSRVIIMFIAMTLIAFFTLFLSLGVEGRRAKTSVAPGEVLTINNESADTIYIEIN